MGHRKQHAPKHGSLAYLPRGRASHANGRIRYWPEVKEGPVLLGFAGYKAGMSYAYMVEDRQRSPNFGKEIANPVTIIEAPPMTVCAVRAYSKDGNVLKTFTEAWAGSLPKDFERIEGVPKEAKPEENLKKMEEGLEKIAEFRILAATQPRLSGTPKKKPDLMEVKVGGATVKEQYDYVSKILGKTIPIEEVFKEGQFVDAVSVSKGKGWQGVVRRWRVAILQHKGNKTKRGIATLGAWGPARVLYTVPRPGQMGYHQRTEFNKRILKIGQNGDEVTPKGDFVRYGPVRNTYIVVKGSVAGPAKRLIRLRYAARPPRGAAASPPQVSYLSVESVQGA
jgi:large subunit ribosomal protein L3